MGGCHFATAMINESKWLVVKKWISFLAPRARVVLFAGLLAAGASGLAWMHPSQAKEARADIVPVRLSVNEQPVGRDGKGVTSFAPVVKKVAPSVVKITVSMKAKNMPNADLPSSDDPFFRRFFGDNFGHGNRRNMPSPKEHGLGSGVIVTRDGYILTNNHVVDNADEVKVALNDGRELTGKVVGKDPKSDIAVLKVDAKDLPAIDLANSDQIEVGDVVLAIGNPFGVGQTVTSGIVSAKDRGNLGLGDYEDWIQTDAAINPGNSGGALVDAEGRLIGINTAILSRSGGNQGIGFAVPSNLAKNVMESLTKEGRVVRGFLGVTIQDVTPALAKEFNLKNAAGAVVADVMPKSPADKAGLKSGDVITQFDGKAVVDSRRLRFQVAQTTPGTTVPVKVLRDGKVQTLEVAVKEMPKDDLASNDRKDGENSSDEALNGVGVSELDSSTRQQMKVPANVKGALVTEVRPDSAAYEAGLRQGDVIQEINRKPVSTADDAVKLTENVKDKKVLLRVYSQGGSHYLVVDESKAG